MHIMDNEILTKHKQNIVSVQNQYVHNQDKEDQKAKEFFDGTWSLPNESPLKEHVETSSEIDVDQLE